MVVEVNMPLNGPAVVFVAVETAAKEEISAAAHRLMRALLYSVTKRGDWVFTPGPRGKPLAILADGTPGPHISLSHTPGLVACALSPAHPVGIDVERHRPRDFAALAAYAFGPRERAFVAAGGMATFYKIWTLREALAKATGEGLAAAADGCDRIGRPGSSGAWTDDAWNFYAAEPKAGYSLALATQGEAAWNEDGISFRFGE
jgi:hypothetical protein